MFESLDLGFDLSNVSNAVLMNLHRLIPASLKRDLDVVYIRELVSASSKVVNSFNLLAFFWLELIEAPFASLSSVLNRFRDPLVESQ